MILVTGGAGYIGSHTCVALLEAGEPVVVFDNFSNSSPVALERVQQISGKSLIAVEGDVRDQDALEKMLAELRCTAVMHFAGLKSVQDSVAQPLEYYDQNVIGSHRLLRAMQKTGVNRIAFSSSATVYGTPQFLPYYRGSSLERHQSLWANEACNRGHVARSPCERLGLGGRYPALLQSRRRA
jgi:UDP-glucose 4-epimerase